jgi:hypothetical protein
LVGVVGPGERCAIFETEPQPSGWGRALNFQANALTVQRSNQRLRLVPAGGCRTTPPPSRGLP